MSDLNNDLEALVGNMGMSVSSEVPENLEQPAAETEETPVETIQEVVQDEAKTVQEVVQNEPQVETPAQEQSKSTLQEEPEVSEEEVEATMLEYLSERLGRKVNSFDEIGETKDTSAKIDERVEAINKFVTETGRSVEDWIAYQSMNPSEMDDLSAIKMQLKSQYGNAVSDEDLNLLVQDKYSLDEDLYDESEIRLAKLQLKLDADKARQEIESVRSQYKTPEQKSAPQEEFEGIVNEQWLETMSSEVDALEGIEFQLSKDKSFTFGLEDNYKTELKSKNEGIEDFFGTYVDESGQWDFERWNMHQAVLDNIETIIKSAYQQGLGEGQRNLVDKAANVQYQPNQIGDTGEGDVPNLEEQLKQALGMNDNGLTFKI